MNAKIRTRSISLLLCLVMLISMLPSTVLASATWGETAGVTPPEAGSVFTASSNPVSYYGRDALSVMANSTALVYAYDQIAAGVAASAETITVYNGTNAITQAELEMVMDAYRRDYAHHFWLDNRYQISSTSTSVVRVKLTYTMSGADLERAKTAFEQKVTSILSGITSSMSEYEKELYLHDKLAGMITYVDGTNAYNAYGALVEGKAVCEGYAEALQYLLQRVGIQSFLAIGSSIDPWTGTPVGHEWNYVRIDGKYYHVDLTWNDQGENLFHAYFNQTDAVIREDHAINAVAYTLPVCNSTTAQYFTGKDSYLDGYTSAAVGQLLKRNGLTAHVYIPGSVDNFLSWYSANILNVAVNAGVTGSFSYSYAQLGRELILMIHTNCTHNILTRQPGLDATCTTDGYAAYYQCPCGKFFANTSASAAIPELDAWKAGAGKIAALNHAYVNGACSRCGESDPTVSLLGDADLDGDVDAYDLTLLARHVGGIELLFDATALQNADVDGDGDVDAYDLTTHARYVGGIITDWEENNG